MNSYKLSIITVSFNSGDTIERAISSVVKQTYLNKEYIIIDGGSTDATLNIIEKYKSDITYWCSEPDEGIYDAMNKGIKKATGEIVAFLNSDDYYVDETVLEKVVRRWNKTKNIDVLAGRIILQNRFSLLCGMSPRVNELEHLCYQMVLDHPAMFVKRKLFYEDGFFDLNYKIAADYAWILKSFHKGRKIITCDEAFTIFCLGGISSNLSKDIIEEVNIISRKINPSNMYEKYKKDIVEVYLKKQKLLARNKRMHENLKIYYHEIKSELNSVFQQRKIAIWGYGMYGQECHDLLDQLGYNIHIIIDIDKTKWQKRKDVEISGEKRLENFDGIVIITPMQYEEEIEMQIRKRKNGDKIGTIRYTEIIDIIERSITENVEKEQIGEE